MQDPDQRHKNIFCYIDAHDLGQMVRKCLETGGLGYQVFNMSNDDNSICLNSSEIIARCYSSVPARSDQMPGSFYANEEAKRL